jgi:hypothetical protein
MTMAWTPVPDTMRRVPKSGAIVLRDFPETPECMLRSPAPERGIQRARLAEARKAWIELSAGAVPEPEELKRSPLLVLQDIVEDHGFMFFVGRAFGHPLINEGHRCQTSLVIGFEGDRIGWARTVSRWYRLQQLTRKH